MILSTRFYNIVGKPYKSIGQSKIIRIRFKRRKSVCIKCKKKKCNSNNYRIGKKLPTTIELLPLKIIIGNIIQFVRA